MPLAPGPFVQQATWQLPYLPGEYDFTDEAASDLAGLNTIGALIDVEMVGLALFAGADDTLIISENIDGLVSDVLTSAGATFLPQLAGVDQVVPLGDSQLGAAFSFAPAAAFSNPPGPYIPPSTSLGPAPEIPPAGYTAAASGPVGGSPVVGPTGTVQLSNTTRLGQPDFFVGDDYLVVIAGQNGADVTLTATLNGVSLGTSDYGPIAADQYLSLTGTIGPENVGVWHEDWAIAGQLVASFDFVVVPS